MPVSTKLVYPHGTWSFVDSCPAHTSPWVGPLQQCAAQVLPIRQRKLLREPFQVDLHQLVSHSLILGAVFPVGLIITVLTGAELFTGDAMLAPMAAFIHKISWAQVLTLWVFVYIGNFIGSVVWAYIMANGPFVTFDAAGVATITAFGTRAIAIMGAKTSYVGMMGLYSAFLKGIGCNWLVNLAILLGICADDAAGKFFGIWFPIMAFVSSGLEHSIANMYFIRAGIMTAGVTNTATTVNWVNMWMSNLIPVTLGNIVGGMFFVGVIYWVAFRKEIAALK